MGRFLCIGICTRISVRRDELKYKFENTGQAVTAIRNYFQIEDEELFKVEEYESGVILNISPEILSKSSVLCWNVLSDTIRNSCIGSSLCL